ncbi:MAG: ABC transporter ATP-binding protein [Promethearchaeota archaeon]|nr:MAG: ABC transporter ATP-binding protein [Candidatus Lokiarchaeota archaeon]
MGMYVGLEAEEYDRVYKDKVLLKRIFHYFSPYKRSMIIVILFLTISSLTYAIVPVLVSIAINNLETIRNISYLFLLISLILILNLFSWVFNYFTVRYSVHVIGNVVLDLRRDAGQAVLNHDLSFFDRNPIGKIVSRTNTDSRDFGQTVDLTLQLISSVLVIMFLLIIMSFINPILTLITIITFPLFFVIALSYRKLARTKTLLGQRALASVNAYVKESFSGIQIAKTFRQEEKLYYNFNEVNLNSYRVNMRRAFVLNAIFPSLGVIQGIVVTLLVFYGGNSILGNLISVGEMSLFIQGLTYLFFPLLTLASFWPTFQTGMAASERIFALIDTLPLVVQNDNLKPLQLKGEIEFKNISFKYEESKDVFEKFNLKINSGESVAIVGHTGAGKSSLAKLLARFYEFQEGDILIDGISIRNYDLTEYRKQVGIIPQTPFLWADTVENNIKYGNKDATKKDVYDALDSTSGSDWVKDLSKGLRTNTGERGSLISMGQRQLVVFARVLLENPAILILDEATASVDPFTETRIQDALQKTIEGRTSIIIAHRLWTVRHVDRIIVLDHGQIVEEGNHEELMTKEGIYAELYNTYFRHQSLEYIEKMKEIVKEKE